MKVQRGKRWIRGGLIFLLLTIFILSSKTSLGLPTKHGGEKAYPAIHPEAEIRKVLAVLENRIEGKKFTEKAKDKLLILSDRQIRLIISLSEVIVQGDPAPVADIAFLLMTVLIIFS